MSADPASSVVNDVAEAAASSALAADQARRAVNDSLSAVEKGLTEIAKAAEGAIRQAVAGLRDRTRVYAGPARETVDEAQRFLVDRIMERPVTAAFTGVGVGLLIGVLLSSRGK